MNETKEPTLDVARRILAELAEMTEHASLTRGLRGGEPAAAQAYNRVLATFLRNGVVPEGMFEPVASEGTEFGALGVQCRLLMAVVSKPKAQKGDDNLHEVIALAPFLDSDDLGRMVMERLGEHGQVPGGLLPALAPFLGSAMLGQIVRRQMKPPVPPSPSAPSTPPTPPQPAPAAPEPPAPDLTPAFRADTAPESLESLVQTLKRPDLTPEDRNRVAMRLAELSYEQAVQA